MIIMHWILFYTKKRKKKRKKKGQGILLYSGLPTTPNGAQSSEYIIYPLCLKHESEFKNHICPSLKHEPEFK